MVKVQTPIKNLYFQHPFGKDEIFDLSIEEANLLMKMLKLFKTRLFFESDFKEEISTLEKFLKDYFETGELTNYTLLPDLLKDIWCLIGGNCEECTNEEKVTLGTICMRLDKLKRKTSKYGLVILAQEYDNASWRTMSPLVYKILSKESIIRRNPYGYWNTWYPTISELEALIKGLNKLLKDPMQNYHVWVFRQKALKLLARLNKEAQHD